MIKTTIATLAQVIKFLLAAIFILFALALFSPTKAVYVLNITVAYCYVLVVTCGNFVINGALALKGLYG